MKKINNKGFMLLETLVVSAFIISTLVYLYIQFANLKGSYDKSFVYDSVPELYSTKQINDFINSNYNYNDLFTAVDRSEDSYVELYKGKCNMTYFSDHQDYCNALMDSIGAKYVILGNANLLDNPNNIKNTYSNLFYHYIKKINVNISSNAYVLVGEYDNNKFASIKIDVDRDGTIKAKNLSYDNTKTHLKCANVQCALDAIAEKVK